MKRLLTLIAMLACICAAYSQNTVYIWKGNTLSVQAADSLTIDRSTNGLVDLGLSVMWAESNVGGLRTYDEAKKAVANLGYGYRLPTQEEWYEIYLRCTLFVQNGKLKVIGPNGNSISLPVCRSSNNGYLYMYWANEASMMCGVDCYDDYMSYNEMCSIGFTDGTKLTRAVREY